MAIKQIRLTGDRTVIFSGDDALAAPVPPVAPDGALTEAQETDHRAAQTAYEEAKTSYDAKWNEYLKTYDVAVLPLVEGRKPTIFQIGSLTIDQVTHIDGMTNFGEKVTETIAYGVHGVAGFVVVTDGQEAIAEVTRRDTKHGKRLTAESLRLFTDDALRWELWGQVKIASALSKEQRKSD